MYFKGGLSRFVQRQNWLQFLFPLRYGRVAWVQHGKGRRLLVKRQSFQKGRKFRRYLIGQQMHYLLQYLQFRYDMILNLTVCMKNNFLRALCKALDLSGYFFIEVSKYVHSIYFFHGKGKNFPSSEKGQNWAMFTLLVTRTYTKT